MAFSIVHPDPGQVIDMDIVDSDIIYVGSLVSLDNSAPTEGALPMPVAAGASNTTNKDIPLGVCIGTNLDSPTYSAAYLTDYITDSTPHGSTTKFIGVEGPYSKGDLVHRAKIHLIDSTTVIRGDIRNAAVSTASGLLTATAGSTAGITVTTNALDVAPVAVYSTIYCRTGANAGAYRVIDTTSTTVTAWDKPMVSDTLIGDTFVVVNGLRPYGVSRMQTGGEATYVNVGAALTADYFIINVRRLDLSVAGSEYVEFTFDGDNFCSARA